jgi:hypothetical protein
VPLTGGIWPMALRVHQYFEIVFDPARRRDDRFHLRLIGYQYTLERQDTAAELYAFHWHPEARSFPHAHVEAGTGIASALVGRHLPTGIVTVEDVLRFAIEELAVEPLRDDWPAVFRETREVATRVLPPRSW